MLSTLLLNRDPFPGQEQQPYTHQWGQKFVEARMERSAGAWRPVLVPVGLTDLHPGIM